MRSVSSDFLKAIKNSTREIKARALLRLDSYIYSDGECTNTTTSSYADGMADQITDNKNYAKKYATLEENYTKLDGSFSVMGNTLDTSEELGWWSGNLADAEGNINEVITIRLPWGNTELLENIFNGFCIKFAEDCYPTEFKVGFGYIIESSGTLDSYGYTFTGNKDVFVKKITDNQLVYFNTVQINITKMNKGNVRARITEFTLGLEEEWTNEDIISIDLVEEIDPTFVNFPSDTLSISITDIDNKYDLINPQGMYEYFKENQEVELEFGARLDSGQMEWVSMGNYCLSTVKSTGGVAKFEFISYLDTLGDYYTRIKPVSTRQTLDTSYGYFTDFADQYLKDRNGEVMELYNQNENCYDENSTIYDKLYYTDMNFIFSDYDMKTVIQYLSALRSFAIKLIKTTNKAYFNVRLLPIEPQLNFTIDLDNSYEYPDIEDLERISEITYVCKIIYASGENASHTTESNTVINKKEYTFFGIDDVGIIKEVKKSDGTIIATTSALANSRKMGDLNVLNDYYIEVTYAGIKVMLADSVESDTETLKPTITYAVLNKIDRKVIKNTGYSSSNKISIDDPLLNVSVENKLHLYQPLQKITCNWRGNPALECGDKIKVEDKYNNIRSAYVTKNTYSYEGYLRCTTELHVLDKGGKS